MTKRLHFHFSLSCIGERNGNPLHCSYLENPREGEPGGLPSMGSHRVGHDWSDLAVAVAAIKKEPNNAICSNMNATRNYHTKWSKSERERQIPSDITYMWNRNIAQMNLSPKQQQTCRQGEETSGCQGGVWQGRGMNWEFGVGRYKLSYLEWINNKALKYSTGNYTQYPMINHNGKDIFKMYIYMCN